MKRRRDTEIGGITVIAFLRITPRRSAKVVAGARPMACVVLEPRSNTLRRKVIETLLRPLASDRVILAVSSNAFRMRSTCIRKT